MKTIEQIALEVAKEHFHGVTENSGHVEFATKFLEAWLAQQTPASHEYQARDGTWHGFLDQRHYESTVEDGSWPIRALYTAPPTAMPEGFENAINEAVKAEREACARVADDWQLDDDCETYLCSCATAIRERVEKK